MKTLLEECPVVVELRCGLVKVATISGKGSRIQGDNGTSSRTSEPRDVSSPGIAFCDIFGGVAVFGRNDFDLLLAMLFYRHVNQVDWNRTIDLNIALLH